MSRLKSLLWVILAVAICTPVWAGGALLHVFAGCTGRISAEMEHAWLMDDPKAKDFEAVRHSFVGILEAIAPPEDAAHMLNLRVDAKLAHAALLTTASFGTDPERADWASKRAAWHVTQCQSLLLDG